LLKASRCLNKHEADDVLTRLVRFAAVPHQDQPGAAEGDDRGAEGDGGAGLPGPAVPDRRGHRQDHEDAKVADAQPPHHRTLQPAQVPGQAAGSQEANRVPHRPRLHGARQGQPEPVQLRRVGRP